MADLLQKVVHDRKRQIDNVQIKHLALCTCAESVLSSSTLKSKPNTCPLHLPSAKISLCTHDIARRTQLPPVQPILHSSVPFALFDLVHVHTGNGQAPKPGRIVDDRSFWHDGSYAVELESSNGESSRRVLDITSTCLTRRGPVEYTSPRHASTWASKLLMSIEHATLEKLLPPGPRVSKSKSDIQAMVDQYTLALDRTQSYESRRNIAIMYVRRSTCFASLGKYTPALEDAEAALVQHQDFPVAYFRKGCALYGLGEVTLAIQAFQQVHQMSTQISKSNQWIIYIDILV